MLQKKNPENQRDPIFNFQIKQNDALLYLYKYSTCDAPRLINYSYPEVPCNICSILHRSYVIVYV